jgi:hypothetical protein
MGWRKIVKYRDAWKLFLKEVRCHMDRSASGERDTRQTSFCETTRRHVPGEYYQGHEDFTLSRRSG